MSSTPGAAAHGTRTAAANGLSPASRATLAQLARAAIPEGGRVAGGGPATVARLETMFGEVPASWKTTIEAASRLLEHGARLSHARAFSSLSPRRQLAYLQRLYDGGYAGRQLLRLLLTPLKVAHFDDPEFFAHLGVDYRREPVVESVAPRYLERAIDAAGLDDGEEIEAEAVVVGTGAGGAAVAAELAERGVAVVMVEEGQWFRRPQFTGRAWDMMRLMYRDRGLTGTVGNCVIPVPLGRSVGGTTTVNSGTCYRAPARVLRKWRDELGLAELGPDALAPHYAKVETIIGAERAKPELVGGIGPILARGCEALGLRSHGPLTRNAPDCDGSSLCCFGCPTDAKRSTNVSYVPLALRYGANLIYGARVERILLEGGRAVGVSAVSSGGQRVTVRARAVVLAAGSLMSPALLLRQGLANRSGRVGHNLSIHPAVGVFALFSEPVEGASHIPQGYGIEDFHDEGLLFEGAFVPPDVGAGSVTFFGERFTRVMERYNDIGFFGFMLEDTSRGRVRLGPGGKPVMTYVMNDHDVARIKRGIEILVRLYLAAGAEAVYPQLPGLVEIHDSRDLERLRRARYRARDFDLTAHHPLGTVPMGPDPATSVVGPTHETHDVPGLFVCDGSSVPSSLGVNPMMTIMAMATRAAPFVARVAEEG